MNSADNLRDILPAFAQLTDERVALWGSMTPQQMVEHLVDTLRASRGIPELPVVIADERRLAAGRRFLFSEQPLPRNVANPLMTSSQPLQYSSLAESVAVLSDEIDEFYQFFAANPAATFAHPYFGALSFGEWLVFHNKHFRHHAEQFGLLNSKENEQ